MEGYKGDDRDNQIENGMEESKFCNTTDETDNNDKCRIGTTKWKKF